MEIPAKVVYAIGTLLELAALSEHGPISCGALAERQGVSASSTEHILAQLRRAGLVHAQRGLGGGYRLTAAAHEITLDSVLDASGSPLLQIAGLPPGETKYLGAAEYLPEVWIALEASLRAVLAQRTLEGVVRGAYPSPGRLT